MNLKFGFLVHNKPVEEYLEYCLRNKLKHLEIDLFNDFNFLESFDEKRIKRVMLMAKKYDVSLSIHPPYLLNLSEKIEIISSANLKYLKRCIVLAKKLGCEFITTYIGNINHQRNFKKARQMALMRAISNLKEAIRECERLKVKLALENTNFMPKDSEIFYLGDNLKDFHLIFSEIDSPYLALCLDLGHSHTNEGVIPYIKRFSNRIINVHYHDNNGFKDEHLNIGDGTINWKEVMKAFNDISYSGPFLSETKDKPEVSMRKLKKYL